LPASRSAASVRIATAVTSTAASSSLGGSSGHGGRQAHAGTCCSASSASIRASCSASAVSTAVRRVAVARARDAGSQSIAIGLPNLARVLVERRFGDRARTVLREGLDAAREIGSARAAQNVVEVTACLAALGGDCRVAARLFGAVEAQMERMNLHRPPGDDAALAAQMAVARHALGADGFSAAEAEGRALSEAQALGETHAFLNHGG
jgi:hypothetical protein